VFLQEKAISEYHCAPRENRIFSMPSDNSVPDYALHSLGWNAFQHLCGTILREVWGQTFQVFADGNDAGRDGAFHGIWKSRNNETMSGSTTVQCKFSSRVGKSLSPSDLDEELTKATELAAQGLADNYVILTNCGFTGESEAEIKRRFEEIPGIRHCVSYGRPWICETIAESQRLRMLVPRLYGLGDLTQILDERAYAQAREILRSMDDELGKFVVTKAHQDSVRALNEHRFVLLLGEPACGKSTIASALALGAADQWGSQLVKVESPEQFHDHWNVNEPRQFFWIDDAFGQTQYERPRALAWNYAFRSLIAAINRGAAVVFTSRDYIYRAALDDLKEEAFPLLREARVVIEVQKLSRLERQQILYNHLKLGKQPQDFRCAVKPFLSAIASSRHFLPEIARRLGDPFFTEDLPLQQNAVMKFVESPQQFLCDVTQRLDGPNRAALGMIFMSGGKLPSLRKLGPEENYALSLLGANLSEVRKALKTLDGTMVIQTNESGEYAWRFKHPTIRDAFGSIVSEEPDLMDVYLAGTQVESLLTEITCGKMRIKGVKLIVPSEQWLKVIGRLDELDLTKGDQSDALREFLANRCHRNFLRLYLERHPRFIASLRYGSWMRYHSAVSVACRLHSCRLLPTVERERFVKVARQLAISTPDADFLDVPSIRALFRPTEIESILQEVFTQLAPKLRGRVSEMRKSCLEEDHDPENYFWLFQRAINIYRRHSRGPSSRSLARFSKASEQAERAVEALKKRKEKMESDLVAEPEAEISEDFQMRSVFDDVDE
jgi:energy-coupling factor transporter ATP-binding protein EcfA2